MIYGAPERAALLDLGGTMMGQLQDWSNEQIQGEYRRQVSNASIAMERERQGLQVLMRENQNDPGSWRKKLTENLPRIRKGIMGGITQPQAKQQVEMELNESFQKWEGWIDESAAKQTAHNTNADFETGVKSFLTESVQFADETDLMEHLGSAFGHIDQGYNGGKLPVDMVPTPAAADALKRNLAQKMIGDYLTQQALATGNEAILDAGNEIGAGVLGQGQPLFGPEELGKLKKQVKAATTAAKGDAEAARQAQADALDQEVTTALLSGHLMKLDKNGKEISYRDILLADTTLTPPRKSTLVEKWDHIAEERAKGKTYSALEQLRAYDKVLTAEPDKQMDTLMRNAHILGDAVSRSLYDRINKAEDTELVGGLNKTIDAIRSVRKDTANYTPEEERKAAQGELDLLRLKKKVLDSFAAHPDWTEKQKIDEMQSILAPAKNEAAKGTVSNLRTYLLKPYWAWPKKQDEQQKPAVNPSPTTIVVGQTMTNRKTGRKIRWDGSAWQPVK